MEDSHVIQGRSVRRQAGSGVGLLFLITLRENRNSMAEKRIFGLVLQGAKLIQGFPACSWDTVRTLSSKQSFDDKNCCIGTDTDYITIEQHRITVCSNPCRPCQMLSPRSLTWMTLWVN